MIKAETIQPILNHILVRDINFGEQVSRSGIVIRSDDGKSEGIKPRWGNVFAVGPDQKDVKVGEWLLIEHGRWKRGIDVESEAEGQFVVHMIDPNGILMVSDEKPSDLELGHLTSP